jgi:cytochrome c oxidase subunit 2
VDPALRGQQLAQQYGCINCHSTDGSEKIGPTWFRLYQSEVELSSGTSVVADDEYLKTAIVNPNLQIVKGFPANVMPDFSNTLDQTMVESLVAYVKTLK